MGIQVEREWWIDEEGTAYVVDLALPVGDGWLPVTFGERPGPTRGLRFAAEDEELERRTRRLGSFEQADEFVAGQANRMDSPCYSTLAR